MKSRLSFDAIKSLLDVQPEDFPKYTKQLMNLANSNAGGTRPAVVGQMSDLIQEFVGNTIDEWRAWYKERHPEGIQNAADKVCDHIEKLKDAIEKIDRKMVESWVEDLVIVKTFVGLRFQEAILKHVAEHRGTTYRLATTEEEAVGIDGVVGAAMICIKPSSYKLMNRLSEVLPADAELIYYDKLDDGIGIEFED